MKISDAPFFKTTPLFYQPLPFYETFLTPHPFLQTFWKLPLPLYRGGVGGFQLCK